MDRSRAEAIVKQHLPEIQRRFGLSHWTVKVDYGPRDNPSHDADCGTNVCYNNAFIGFNPEKYDDEETLVVDIRHELFHVVLAPFNLFYHLAMTGVEGDQLERANRLWDYAAEQIVIALERMHQGLTTPTESP